MLKTSDILPLISSVLLSVVFVYAWIKYMELRNMGQFIREEGPQSHLAKSGIPTMGGFAFILASLIISFMFISFDSNLIYIFTTVILFGLIGFYDDYKKIKKKQNEGLSARDKFILILLISLIVYYEFLYQFELTIPLTGITTSNILICAVFIALLYAAVTNATNFTDGLDGLLAISILPVTILFASVATYKGMEELRLFNIIFLGAMLGYLIFNIYPAKVFMGDLGSIAIGAYIVSNSIVLDIYWFIPLFGIWYLIEVLSVIIQVLYFKKTGGKRFFKMAPFHHHLEYVGYSEVKIDFLVFAINSVTSLASFFIFTLLA